MRAEAHGAANRDGISKIPLGDGPTGRGPAKWNWFALTGFFDRLTRLIGPRFFTNTGAKNAAGTPALPTPA